MKPETITIRMPDLGDVTGAVVVQWLKPLRAHLQEGEDLVEVETEKTTFVIPAPADGRLSNIQAPERTPINTGEALGDIELASRAAPSSA